MGFPAQDQCKVINRVVAVVHEHLDVIQDSGIQVLGFINGEKKRLAFVKRIERESVKRTLHQPSPPALE